MFEVSPKPAGLERVRFAAADMDRTLLTDESELPEGFDEAVRAFASVGGEFAIASGRPMTTLLNNMAPYVGEMTLVSDNGGAIAHHGEIIYQAKFAPEDYQRMAAATHELGGIAMICGTETGFFEANSKPYEDYFRTFYTNIEYVENLEQVEAPAVKFSVYFPNNDAQAWGDKYRALIGEEYEYTYGGIMWLDIQLKGVSKGSAMKHVSDALGIGLDEMAAFGDAPNDAAMLKTVGFGYMVANAEPSMAAFAKYVAPSNQERGVLQVLKQITEARREAGYGQ